MHTGEGACATPAPQAESVYTVPKLADYTQDTLTRETQRLLDALAAEDAEVKTEEQLRAFRDRWMARKNGIKTQINDLWLKAAPMEHRRAVGQVVNGLVTQIEDAVTQRASWVNTYGLIGAVLKEQEMPAEEARKQRFSAEALDVTLPGTRRPLGAEHPVIRTMNEIVGIFRNLGYSVGDGPEIESDYYNFESLNFPPDHPARDTQDTLFVAGQAKRPQRDRLLLRTHTSPVQIRTMEKHPPPVRIVIPGKVHRHDTADATHSPIFHQVEGLAVDRNITLCDLKGTLDHAMKQLFGSGVKTRFFPSFFPFTEPSADVQVSCFKCGGKGCRICKQSGWIEVLGCGMVDPNVFEFVKQNGYDPAEVSGFAFGMGIERLAMLKYEIDDIQLFYQGDVRFLEQFA
jgi:phenylalanyl-tRNA synthetase alpha chain